MVKWSNIWPARAFTRATTRFSMENAGSYYPFQSHAQESQIRGAWKIIYRSSKWILSELLLLSDRFNFDGLFTMVAYRKSPLHLTLALHYADKGYNVKMGLCSTATYAVL